MWYNMKYFKLEEFACPCCGENMISQSLVDRLDKARELAGVPFVINSGYRCEKHNAEVGGSKTSSHLLGLAVDIKTTNSMDRYAILRSLEQVGITRFGIGKSFIHCDIDIAKPIKVIWTYYGEA